MVVLLLVIDLRTARELEMLRCDWTMLSMANRKRGVLGGVQR